MTDNLRYIDGRVWFCCPKCGKKLHPVAPGARGVFAKCGGRTQTGARCTWSGEIEWDDTEQVTGK
nr:MAG TPA: cysteine-rich protein [Caudoviricetes sp.]